MAREFVLRQGEDESPEYDLTDATSAVHVIWEEMEVGGRAFRGESDAGIIPMRDEQGETGDDVNLPSGLEIVSLSRGSTWEWLENAGEAGEVVMARGRIGPKDYSRGRQKADRAREVSVTVTDPNEHLQLIIVDDWVRPEETDVERVTALLAAYLDGDPRPTTVIAGTYVSSANPVTLEAHTYDGSSPHEVLQDVALKSNKNFFVTVDNELFYDAWDSTAYPAGIRISDRPEEWDDEGGELFGRLYFSGTNVDDPELDFDSVWDGAAAGAQVELTLTKGTTVDDSVSGNPEATPPKDRGLRRGMYQLSGTGTLSGHVKCFIRAYDGEDDPFSSQSTQSQMVIKIFSEDGSTLRGVVLDAYEPVALDSTDWDGTLRNTKFPASALWEGTNGAPINTVHWEDGDWLVVEVGYRFFAAEGSAEGGVYFNDTAATADLPEDEVETDNLAPWIEFTPSASITVGPIWDVGAASTEDGLELRCGMRLYYGEEGAYVYHHDDTIHDRYWHSEESVYTSDPTITDATKAEALLLAMYERRKEEERTYNLSIGPLNEDQVGLIKYGQLIYVKARAIPDADDQFMPRRIAQLRWTTPRPGVFFARMQLSRPRKQEPYSVGPKDAVQTTTKHATAGTHPASNITIIDSAGHFSATDVEAALDELADDIDALSPGGGVGWFNVQDYGAVGDGTTDDLTAINDAITALNSAGAGVLYFPHGHYVASDALDAITALCRIIGDGVEAWDQSGQGSAVECTSSTAALFTISSKRATFEHLTLFNETSASAGAAIVVTSAYSGQRTNYREVVVRGFYDGIDSQSGTAWVMDACAIMGQVRYSVRIRNINNDDVGDWSISNTYLTATSGTVNAAIRIESSGGGKIVNTKINAFGGSSYTHGIDLAGGGSTTVILLVANSSIENVSDDGIHVTTTGAGTWPAIVVNGCEFGLWGNNTGYAVSFNAASAGNLSEIVIGHNVFITNGTARSAVELINVDNVVLAGNVLSGFDDLYDATTSTNIVELGGSGASALDDLSDVVISSATADDDLRFNGVNWVNDARKWEAVTNGEDVFVWEGDDLVHDWNA